MTGSFDRQASTQARKNVLAKQRFSETWLNDSNESTLALPNYSHVCASRANRAGGGVSLHIHNTMKFKNCPKLNKFNNLIESVFVEIELPNQQNNIIVGACYRPPGCSLNLFTGELSTILNNIKNTTKRCYIAGDFNVDLALYNLQNDVTEFYDVLNSFSFTPLITKPTRSSLQRNSINDNIFTNLTVQNHSSGVIHTDISDHFPIFAHTVMHTDPIVKKSISFQSFSQANLEKFKTSVYGDSWEEVYASSDALAAYTLFSEKLKRHFDAAFPIINRPPTKRDLNPWITTALKTSIKRKNLLYNIYKRRPRTL